MVQLRLVASLVAVSLAAAACGTRRDTEPSAVGRSQRAVGRVEATARRACPRAILYDASSLAPVKQVLLAAQRLLAQQRYESQGRIYRLTPRNAPIDEVFRMAAFDGPLDETQPGLRVLHRAAARQCGERTAQASWAIHYWIPVSVIANAGGWPFIVKTKTGWRFWGYWCGTGKPRQWRNYYCF